MEKKVERIANCGYGSCPDFDPDSRGNCRSEKIISLLECQNYFPLNGEQEQPLQIPSGEQNIAKNQFSTDNPDYVVGVDGEIVDFGSFLATGKRRTLEQKIPYDDERLIEIGSDMARKVENRTKQDAEKSRLSKEFNQRINALDTEISNLAEDYSRGYDYAEVSTVLYLDVERRRRLWCDDDGRVILDAPFEPGDEQLEIPVEAVVDAEPEEGEML